MRKLILAPIVIAMLVGPAGAAPLASPGVINNWPDLRAAFVKCWTVPEGTEGSLVSFAFLLDRDGRLRGPPRIQGRVLKGSQEAQQKFLASAYGTLEHCLPVAISPSFRASMGETLVNLRLVNTPREPSRNLGAWMSIFAEETKPR